MPEEHKFTHNGWQVTTWESKFRIGDWLFIATRGTADCVNNSVTAFNRVQAEREIRLMLNEI